MNFQDELAYFIDHLREVISTPFGDFPDADERKPAKDRKQKKPTKIKMRKEGAEALHEATANEAISISGFRKIT